MSSRPAIRIALADDHPVFRDGVRQLLSLEPDLEVVAEANDGEEVIGVLKETRPDVLLLDLSMPGLDGHTTLCRLRTETFSTKIIVLTASEDQDQHVRAVGYGASAVVLKQMATELLTASIRRVYEGEVWLDGGMTAAIMKSLGGPSSADVALTTRQREVVELVAQGCVKLGPEGFNFTVHPCFERFKAGLQHGDLVANLRQSALERLGEFVEPLLLGVFEHLRQHLRLLLAEARPLQLAGVLQSVRNGHCPPG